MIWLVWLSFCLKFVVYLIFFIYCINSNINSTNWMRMNRRAEQGCRTATHPEQLSGAHVEVAVVYICSNQSVVRRGLCICDNLSHKEVEKRVRPATLEALFTCKQCHATSNSDAIYNRTLWMPGFIYLVRLLGKNQTVLLNFWFYWWATTLNSDNLTKYFMILRLCIVFTAQIKQNGINSCLFAMEAV